MISLRGLWGMALMVLIVVVWLPSILTVPPIEASRSPSFHEGSQMNREPSAPFLLSVAPAEIVRSPNLDERIRKAVHQLSRKEGGRDRAVPIEKSTEQLSRLKGDGVAERSDEVADLPAIRECPAFLNGRECVTSRKTRELDGVCDGTAVHIAMALDAEYLRGSMAAIFSILKHSACPENVIFHFIVSARDVELGSLCQRTFPYLRFKLYHFDERLVKNLISPSYRTALEEPLNYARNYLADMLEDCVERVIYLDSDLVVVDDIATLWNTNLGPHAIGAPEYCQANLTRYFTPAFWDNSSLTSTFQNREPCYFNTGVMVMDLAKWRQEDYTKRIEMWMGIQKESRIYALGSLPPFLLVFAGSVQPIDHRWNQHGLGGDIEGECRFLYPGPVSLLHWSGKWKPWIRLDNHAPCPLDKLWAPYDLLFRPRMHS